MMVRRIAVVAVLLLMVPPAGASAQRTFDAVLVHGLEGFKPFLIEADADCMWFTTYNVSGAGPDTRPEAELPVVTLSLFTHAVWDRIKALPGGIPDSATASRATFHTQIVLTPLGTPPHLLYKKPRNADFVSKMAMHPASEALLASRGIPTRVAADGTPYVRQYSPEESEQLALEWSKIFRHLDFCADPLRRAGSPSAAASRQ